MNGVRRTEEEVSPRTQLETVFIGYNLNGMLIRITDSRTFTKCIY